MLPRNAPALVTGAASGLGAATARALAAAGAPVALLDLSADRLSPLAAETGGLALACDVTDAVSAEQAVAAAAEAHGPARILVNCAGIAPAGRIVGRGGPLPLDDFARVVAVNLIGTFNLMRLAAAAMATLDPLEDGERGVIVNTASVAAYEGQIGQAAYAASKGGVASLTLPAARELARYGIRVAAIAPGLFGTPMVTAMPQEVQDAIVATIPFPRRFGRPEEYARMALSIIENPMVNGSVIRLDAALRMQGA
ncbi:SDR family NAD(P)-dependent oxidoreductase [Azospirillum sp. RWY-5-1]|uniref:SDR family NAD(P)-dependent oxidoreductase n=1 Tax=Azospirillum oleiclasticum TaxID=2735135 RepID=A0ABX2TJJ6_9PROT|nr:SDR family NAD(P)-dependent oxidoreductase [Azospirillum oleiclasticum]NYZ14394.1 SDR family NAD(P)-dependent oxidoreductase [Azospirillum oleiclasticum]NYZ23254.1 SDR family NAD(P)-dependent oxidoreductase [Azospirillum oleiclasticum]